MEAKINMMFKLATREGYDSLILGALGCGQFKNPPHAVAEAFQKAVRLYKNYFRVIGFAILMLKPSDKDIFDIFQAIC